ncbi:MAG: LCP family protein [Patescibacteria group bacterium]
MRRPLIVIFFLLLGSLVVWQLTDFGQPRIFEIKNPSAGSFMADWPGPTEQPVSPFSEPGSTNFLLLGAPGAGNDAPDLTDTILIARLDPAQQKIFLFSLPRDLWVKIPQRQIFTKLNALYALNKRNTGQELTDLITKVQEISGLLIDHYIFVDLTTVKTLVDLFGGVNLLVKEGIVDDQFPGPNHSFQRFEIKAGWRYLDGATALKYIRSRHSLNGDFDRIGRQQEVLQALKQKVLALNFWDIGKFMDIYNALSANIKSDLSLWQIKSYWDKIKNIPGANLVRNEINNQNLLTSSQVSLAGTLASVLQPKAGIENYEEIKSYVQEIIKN